MHKKPNDFGLKHGNQKLNKKADWINKLKRAQRRPESGNTHRFTQNDTKKSNWKTAGHDGIHGFWFKKLTSIYDRLALEMNRCIQRAHVREWMTQGRTTLIQKGHKQRNRPKQLQTHNLPTDGMENNNRTNKRRDLLLTQKSRIIP